MGERSIRRIVTVPDVVGLPFHVGRDVAAEARVALANPDPDGPAIGSLAWPGLFYIVWQHPEPGTELREWDSVAVRVVKHGDAPEREPADPLDAPPADSAHAQPDRERYLDLTEGDSRD